LAFWSAKTWKEQDNLPTQVVEPFDPKFVDESGYRLRIGPEVYLAKSDNSEVTYLDIKQQFAIDPGQFAFILTEEIVRIPGNAIGFISMRAKVKFRGLVNVSGFHVDPGYHGRLIFAVFNAGPNRVNFCRGDAIFSLWMSKTDHELTQVREGPMHIESDVINLLDGKYLTAYQLSDEIKALKDTISSIKQWSIIGAFAFAVIILPFVKNSIESYVGFFKEATTQGTQPEITNEAESSDE